MTVFMQHHQISVMENWTKLALANNVLVPIGLNGKNGVIVLLHVIVENDGGHVVACSVQGAQGARRTHLTSSPVTRTVVLTGTNGLNGNLVLKHVVLESVSERVAVMDSIA